MKINLTQTIASRIRNGSQEDAKTAFREGVEQFLSNPSSLNQNVLERITRLYQERFDVY